MNKTIKINISGIVFQIEEDAFEMLRNYLLSITNRLKHLPNGNETIDDIESRIAEIFQSQKGLAGMISLENVKAMIQIIGEPQEFGDSENNDFVPGYSAHRRRLYKSRENSILSGVCGGIGGYLNADPVWIRILFILFACFFGIGIFIYLALWIALTPAITEDQKRDLYGNNYHLASARQKPGNAKGFSGTTAKSDVHDGINNVGNAFNEIFRAIGKCFVIFFRIILIITGVVFVIASFLALLSFIMIVFFKYPGFIQTDSFNSDLFNLPDLLGYFLSPTVTLWVIALLTVAVLLPLLAIIYWGIKMIFQFRAKDGIISLVMLLLWIGSIVILSMLLFSQGISFAEYGRSTENIIISNSPDTIFIKVDNRISSLKYDKELSIPGENNYRLLINTSSDELFIQPDINILTSDDLQTTIEIVKSSQGRTRNEAVRKADNLTFNYRLSNDTIYLDEFYMVPPENKWSVAEIDMNIFLPAGIVVYFDKRSETLFDDYVSNGIYSMDLGNKYWLMTEDGLTETVKNIN